MKRLLATIAAILCAGGLAFGANLSLLTGPQPAGDIVSIVNTLIRSINNGVSGLLFANVQGKNTGADTTEDTLFTYTLPGNTVAVGQGLRVRCWGSTLANGNNKTMKLYFGSESISTGAQASNNQSWFLNALVMRATSTVQLVQLDGMAGTGSVTPVATSSTSGSEDMTGAITIKCTGTNGTANAGDVEGHGMIVEAIR